MPPKKDKGKKPAANPEGSQTWYDAVTKKPVAEEDLQDTAQSSSQKPKTDAEIEKKLKLLDSLLETPEVLRAFQSKSKPVECLSSGSATNQTLTKDTYNTNLPLTQITPDNTSTNTISKAVSTYVVHSKPLQEWYTKDVYQNIITAEGLTDGGNPFHILEKMFGKNRYYKPWDITKTPNFYEAILQETGSAAFKHFFLDQSHTNAAYSTCKIIGVISPDNWSVELTKPIFLSKQYQNEPFANTPYNYWEYQQAWYNAFFIQNQKRSHTWLFYFDTKKCNPMSFPSWWIMWWEHFGSSSEILRSDVLYTYNTFRSTYNPLPKEKRFQPLSLFCAKFYLPWVLSWTLETAENPIYKALPLVRRKYKIKWWDSFKVPMSISTTEVEKWVKLANAAAKVPKEIQDKFQSPDQTEFLAKKSKMAALLAGAKNIDEMHAIMQQYAPEASSSRTLSLPDDFEEGYEPLFGNSGI